LIRSRLVPFTDGLSRLPWWALLTAMLGVLIAWHFATHEIYQKIVERLASGLIVTVRITLIAYSAALTLALLIALARVSKNVLIYNIATFYVEIVRGLPTLVLLLYVAFVLIPGLIVGLNGLGSTLAPFSALSGLADFLQQFRTRDIINELRVVVTLIIAYSAFLSEVFRGGIVAVEVGQMEAARALGMTYWQAMRHVVLPQAFRIALPALGNDFIAMLKDSSLASVLGVEEITRLAQNYGSSSFLYLETYNVLAYLYLVMTLGLSMFVKLIERRTTRERPRR